MTMTTAARILVVDDEDGVRFFLQEALARDGHEVVAVDCGEAALQRIATETFDLALIDLKMPGIGGIEVLTSLRRRSPETAAIVLTAFGSLETAVEALRQGAHDYLFKPCKMADLRASVHTALVKQQRQNRQRVLLEELASALAASVKEIQATVEAPAERPAAALPRLETPASEGQQDRLVVDQIRHIITLDGRQLDLSPTEFRLVAYLVEVAPRVVDAQELMRQVQGYECTPLEARELVRYHIYRIRQKVKLSGGNGDVIVTVRSIGYTVSMRAQV
jgi:DNA-binding response OmpR family regulator